MKNRIHSFIIICLFTIVSSCSLGDNEGELEPQQGFTITQIVNLSSGLSTLEQALQITGLNTTLDGNGAFTLFAPSDIAFQNFLDGRTLSDIPVDDLRQLLLNHIISRTLTTDQLSGIGSGYVNTISSAGPNGSNLSLFFNTSSGFVLNGGPTNGGANIIPELTNSVASNGIVHIVDTVMELPNIETFLVADSDLDSLSDAFNTNGLTTDFISFLSSQGNSAPFTVFIPNNSAFESLLTTLSINELGDLDPDTLESILNYHIIESSNLRSENLNSGLAITTRNGETITIDALNTVVDTGNRSGNIITIDIQTTNGVMHITDIVLLPNLP
ncbi:hypothetical protein GTQ40_16810 [Flavobacteriaceae bacterium R38]|nr:hypothetical protein [Flavobacteriaceae bacterium R38]